MNIALVSVGNVYVVKRSPYLHCESGDQTLRSLYFNEPTPIFRVLHTGSDSSGLLPALLCSIQGFYPAILFVFRFVSRRTLY